MALEGPINYSGLAIPTAYVVITSFDFMSQVDVMMHIATYGTAAAFAATPNETLYTSTQTFTYDLALSDNLYTQAYAYLLTLPAYAGFIDC
jgi:hypothetical protein